MPLSSEQLETAYQLLTKLILEKVSSLTCGCEVIAEIDCVSAVKNAQVYPWASSVLLATFQQHFIVRHCFYRFIQQIETYPNLNGKTLTASAKGLELRVISNSASKNRVDDYQGSDELKAFYMDIQHFDSATEDTVADLLASFWSKYHALDQVKDALQILGLEPSAEWPAIQSRYRELAQKHHPDRGGDADAFIALKDAFTALKHVHKPQ